MGKFQDLIGNKYGFLEVVEVSGKSDKYDNIYWNCRCECGKERIVRGSSLKNGHTKSCGCIKLVEDDSGKVFGELTVLGRAEKKSSSIFLNCLCSCGSPVTVRRDLLIRKKKIFCADKSKHKQQNSLLIDETGRIYGKLTVLKIHHKKIVSKGTLWDCLCECGNLVVIRAALLRNGTKNSCGCDRDSMYKDENGKKYGKWTVRSLSKKKGTYGEVYWDCICECGTEREVQGSRLRKGFSKSCGCTPNNEIRKSFIEEMGNRYGHLEVLERAHTTKARKVYWKCRCDCGNLTIVRGDKMRSGHTQSCGCLKISADLTSKTFGKLTVIKFDQIRKREGYWRCSCQCGKEASKRGTDLRNGHVLACSKGCLAEDNFLETGINSIISQYRGMAKRKNREYALSREDVEKIVFQNCYYCEAPPSNELRTNRTKKLKFKYTGIDRIDSSRGYILDNIRPCCSFCNRAKADLSEYEFLQRISLVSNKNKI